MKFINFSRALCAMTLMALAVITAKAQDQVAPAVQDLVGTAYRWGDFAELERLYAIYGKAGVRSELTGTPRLDQFWKGIGEINNSNLRVTDEYYQQLDALTRQWAHQYPQSVLAQLLYAKTLMAHAWVRRGDGYVNTVSPTAWAEFREYLDLAKEQLQKTEALAAKDSTWNRSMLEIGLHLDWDREHLMQVFEAGIAKNPDDDDLYFAMQKALLPKWGGDLKAVDRFIAWADKNTREKRGLEMYARLYAGLSYGQVHQTLFTSTNASWTSMKIGFEDRLKRYPHTDHRNMYAYFACMANDRPALQEQLELIGGKFEPIFWGGYPERTFEACKKMAQQV
ncbi:DUF4034 domain-containing protein [Rugamonas sp. DEMB1]|uniref:DUF4034 domain-containing protein n=1 Tax=Rugamonas sp. DEMB1 TaxID=3039386 RepID=UPI00244C982B|nr:DUF4034 domain-containing protein [Rugamonas sp. DEMB1]WGG49882.1 DUF4034 domain-containing protein [Rugamonas sp. DEMB1]